MADYAAEYAGYRVEVPERFNAVEAIVDTWGAEDPEAAAVLSLDAAGRIVHLDTAATLAASSRRTARALIERGIGKGDHVFVMLPRVHQWYAALLGCMRIGAVPMPGPNLLTAKDIAYRVQQAGAAAAITDEAGAAKVDEAAPTPAKSTSSTKCPRPSAARSAAPNYAAGSWTTGCRNREVHVDAQFVEGANPQPRMDDEKPRVRELCDEDVFEQVLVRTDSTGAYLVAEADSAETLNGHLNTLPFVQDRIMTMELTTIEMLESRSARE